MVLGLLMITGASLTASVLVLQMAILPLLFRYSKSVQNKMVFPNCINFPKNIDYDKPACVDVVGGRNLQVEFESKVDKMPIKLGIWHMIPCSLFKDVFVVRDHVIVANHMHKELARTLKPVVLYLHGNSNHRASPYRLMMYKLFQELDYHVITFDYRGYGDSTMVRPTEKGVVEDALQVYSWLHNSLKGEEKPTVFLWGHSLGTAVAANLVANLEKLCSDSEKPTVPLPDALVLESAFNNLKSEIEGHPFSKLVSWLPYYQSSFVKPFCCSDFAFTTDAYLQKVPDIPILILHSQFDKIVPRDLAVKLHDTILESRSAGGAPVVFHTFKDHWCLGHNNLCQAKDMKDIIANFVDSLKISSDKNED